MVKDIEARLSVMDTDITVLEGTSSKHALSWNKAQTEVKKRVAAVEAILAKQPGVKSVQGALDRLVYDVDTVETKVAELSVSMQALNATVA